MVGNGQGRQLWDFQIEIFLYDSPAGGWIVQKRTKPPKFVEEKTLAAVRKFGAENFLCGNSKKSIDTRRPRWYNAHVARESERRADERGAREPPTAPHLENWIY